MALRAGQLRHRVKIQSATQVQSASGEVTRTWTTDAVVWASVDPLTGREFIDAQQVSAGLSHRVRMRHRDGVSPKMRIEHDGRTLQVESVMNVGERNRELELLCKEAV